MRVCRSVRMRTDERAARTCSRTRRCANEGHAAVFGWVERDTARAGETAVHGGEERRGYVSGAVVWRHAREEPMHVGAKWGVSISEFLGNGIPEGIQGMEFRKEFSARSRRSEAPCGRELAPACVTHPLKIFGL